MKRVGRIVKIKPDYKDRYIQLHSEPWKEVTEAIRNCGIRNFSIFLRGEYLFSYFEYVGDDYDRDMKQLDSQTSEWLKETDACQEAISGAEDGELWSVMKQIFYQE